MEPPLPLLLFLLVGLNIQAGQNILLPPQTPVAPASRPDRDICTFLKDLPYLYKKKDHPVIQEFKLLVTGQYQGAWVSPSGKNNFRKGSGGHNDEWRRAYLGFDVRLFNKKLFIHSMNDVGELDGQYKTRNGPWSRAETDWGIYELYAQYIEEPLAVKLGKIAPKMTGEYRTSSSEIKTIERSNMVNQLGSVSNWGVEFSNIPSVTTYPKWVDTLNSFYLGLNYYVCPDNPHMIKLMTGMEYTATEKTAYSAKSFNGWTWLAALRFRF